MILRQHGSSVAEGGGAARGEVSCFYRTFWVFLFVRMLARLATASGVFTCEGSRALGKMALTGLSRGDRQAFSLECLCFSAIWGDPGNQQHEALARNAAFLPTNRETTACTRARIALASLASN